MPPSTTHLHRPRPGPLRALVVLAILAVATSGAFGLLVAIGEPRTAAGLLLALPIAAVVLRLPRLRDYVARHAGLAASGHLLVAVWAAGMAAAAIGDADAVRISALTSGAASVVAGVRFVVWARFPRELAAAGLPGLHPTRGLVRALPDALVLLVAAGMTAATASIVGWLSAGTTVAWLAATALVYGVHALIDLGAAVRRVIRGDGSVRPRVAAAVAELRPEVVVHFSGSVQTVYQLDQWMPSIRSGGWRVLVVAREYPTYCELARRFPDPIVFVRDFPDLDLIVGPWIGVALYLNTATKNNHLVRFEGIRHVQLHHGDSDKPVSSSKTMRLYDHHVVAGQAAVDRLGEAGIPASLVTPVGRPQTHGMVSGRLGHRRPVLLYAPTWEGFHVDTPLSSVLSMGQALVGAVPADIDVVVRPHPLTGTVDRRYRREVASIRAAVLARGDGSHFVDPRASDLRASLAEADILVADVSSVIVDFLAADRPALVTDVLGLGPDEHHRRYPSTSWAAVVEPDLGNLGALLADAMGEDGLSADRRRARDRLLGDPDGAEARFHAVVDRLLGR